MTDKAPTDVEQTPFLGLAPFLRASIEGQDLQAFARAALGNLNQAPHDANLWMNLSTLMFSLGQRESAFATLNQGLSLQRLFDIPALTQPSRFRILMLMVPGDIAANTPLDCLLEGSDIDLICYYSALDSLFPDPAPTPRRRLRCYRRCSRESPASNRTGIRSQHLAGARSESP